MVRWYLIRVHHPLHIFLGKAPPCTSEGAAGHRAHCPRQSGGWMSQASHWGLHTDEPLFLLQDFTLGCCSPGTAYGHAPPLHSFPCPPSHHHVEPSSSRKIWVNRRALSGGRKVQNQAGHVVTRVPGPLPPWRPAPPLGSASPGRPTPFGYVTLSAVSVACDQRVPGWFMHRFRSEPEWKPMTTNS